VVYSCSVVWRPASPEFQSPYAVGIIDVEEGWQMLANLIGCDSDEVYIGMPVTVEFHEIGAGYSLPYFRPDAD
jgi:uncharacterized OB-fold protein